MKLFKKTKISTGDDETFVRLIQVAMKDPEIKNQLTTILSFDDFNRKSALNTMIHDLKLNRAPQEIIAAITCLLDDKVAQQTIHFLKDQKNQQLFR